MKEGYKQISEKAGLNIRNYGQHTKEFDFTKDLTDRDKIHNEIVSKLKTALTKLAKYDKGK